MATILYIDDDDLHGRMIDALLDLHGFTVETARDGLEGMKKARELRPDLILLDLYLPPLGGLEVARQLRGKSLTDSIPIVVVSALPTVQGRRLMQGTGVQDFISKPFQIEELIGIIRKNLSQGEAQPSTSIVH